MKCPKCGSENVTVQMVSETNLKKSIEVYSGGFLLAGGGFLLNGCS